MKTITKRILSRVVPLIALFIFFNAMLWLDFLTKKSSEIHINMVTMPPFSIFLAIMASIGIIVQEKRKLAAKEDRANNN